MSLDNFWGSPVAIGLKHPEPVRQLLGTLAGDEAARYDLLFYAAFAKKMLTIMRREGAETQGFARMQQSFKEAVEKVRAAVEQAEGKGFSRASQYTELSQAGMARMLELIDDLAIVKEWQVQVEGDGNAMQRKDS